MFYLKKATVQSIHMILATQTGLFYLETPHEKKRPPCNNLLVQKLGLGVKPSSMIPYSLIWYETVWYVW
jgi:hypothetical protein